MQQHNCGNSGRVCVDVFDCLQDLTQNILMRLSQSFA